MIRLAIRRKNLFIFDTHTPPGKIILFKGRSKSTYLLSKNPQIKLWYQQLRYTSNIRVVKAFKLIDGIAITIKDSQQIQKKSFFSDFKNDNKNKNSELSPASDIPSILATMLLNKITSIGINSNDSIDQLYHFCIKSKYTKIVKYKKMIPTICKLKEIYTNL